MSDRVSILRVKTRHVAREFGRSGLHPKGEFQERVTQFTHGEWHLLLVERGPQETMERRAECAEVFGFIWGFCLQVGRFWRVQFWHQATSRFGRVLTSATRHPLPVREPMLVDLISHLPANPFLFEPCCLLEEFEVCHTGCGWRPNRHDRRTLAPSSWVLGHVPGICTRDRPSAILEAIRLGRATAASGASWWEILSGPCFPERLSNSRHLPWNKSLPRSNMYRR